MQRHIPPPDPRPARTGPFFDYVLTAMQHQALRARARHATLLQHERRIAVSRQTSAEQRWEGEGGSMRECTPGGPAGPMLKA